MLEPDQGDQDHAHLMGHNTYSILAYEVGMTCIEPKQAPSPIMRGHRK